MVLFPPSSQSPFLSLYRLVADTCTIATDHYNPSSLHSMLPPLSPSPSTMTISSLPTELVRQIIESAISSTYHSTTYVERQTILCALCLVSHRFRSIAQPLLFEIVRLSDWGEEISSHLANFASGQCARTRQAVIMARALPTNRVVEAFPDVTTLTLKDFPEDGIDLSPLAHLRSMFFFSGLI